MRVTWTPNEYGGFEYRIGDVVLYVVPVRTVTRKFKTTAARGSLWRAGCSRWDAATSTLARYGRDRSDEHVTKMIDAKTIAIEIYNEATP